MTPRTSTPRPLPGLWREFGEGELLVRLDTPVDVEGMCMVARLGSDWRRRPALRWRTWAEDLVSATPPGSATAGSARP